MRMTSGSFTVEQVIDGSLDSWFNEHFDATVENINRVGSPTSG
jgi:hypothetical protein